MSTAHAPYQHPTRRDFVRSAFAAGAAAMVSGLAGGSALASAAQGRAALAGTAAPQRFRVGYQIFSFGRYFPAQWWLGARTVGAMGYPGIEGEYTIAELYEGREQEFADRMAECGVKLAAFYTSTDLERPDNQAENTRKNMLAARFLAKQGGKVMVMGGTSAITRDDEAFRIFNAAANALGKRMFEEHGVRLSYHPHLGALIQGPVDIDKVMEGTDPRWFSLAPDTGHLVAGGSDEVEVFTKYRDRIIHLHLKDYIKPKGPNERGRFVPLGQGTVRTRELIDILRGAGFDGWVDLEMDGGRGLLPADVAAMAKTYVTGPLGLALDPAAGGKR